MRRMRYLKIESKKKDKELLMKRRSQRDLGHANKIKDDFNIQ